MTSAEILISFLVAAAAGAVNAVAGAGTHISFAMLLALGGRAVGQLQPRFCVGSWSRSVGVGDS